MTRLGEEPAVERRNVNPWSWQDQFGFSHAVEISGYQRMLVCAGQTSNDADGNVLHAHDRRGGIRGDLYQIKPRKLCTL